MTRNKRRRRILNQLAYAYGLHRQGLHESAWRNLVYAAEDLKYLESGSER